MMGSTSSAVLDKTCDLATKGHLSDRLFRICARIGTNSKTILTYRMKWSSICPSYGKHRKSLSMRHSNAKWLIYIYIYPKLIKNCHLSQKLPLFFNVFFSWWGGGASCNMSSCERERDGVEVPPDARSVACWDHNSFQLSSIWLRQGRSGALFI